MISHATKRKAIVGGLVGYLILIVGLIAQIKLNEPVTRVFPSGDTTHIVWGTRMGFFQGRVHTYNAMPWLFSGPTEFLTTPDEKEYRIESDGSIWQRTPWLVNGVRAGYKVEKLQKLHPEVEQFFKYGRTKAAETPPEKVAF